ncbi:MULTISPECIES: hypothetical protein [unclassified Streptomyces]|uniref:hypothetical protein n=1 Tax=unclassified Streptomyces TaxID=2593676 RepID=UPI0034245608
MSAEPRADLDREQLAALDAAMREEREAAYSQRYLVRPELPVVPCPACGEPAGMVREDEYEDGTLHIDVDPCGHQFRSRVDYREEWRP